jgi:hypothetical protein
MNAEQFNKFADNNEAINFEPVFDFESNRQSILLRTDQAKLRSTNGTFPCYSEARLDLLMSPRIYFHLTSIDDRDDRDNIWRGLNLIFGDRTSTLCVDNKPTEGFIVSCNSNGGKFFAKWSPQQTPLTVIGEDNTLINNVVFHIFNFPDFIWQSVIIPYKNGETSICWLELGNEMWNVCIKSLPTTHDNIKLLSNEGGYLLTHIGQLRKVNHEPIKGKEAFEFLHCLTFFLSFVCGTWVNPVCPVGFSVDGEKQWEQWSSPRSDWKKPTFTWSHEQGFTQMESLFPVFQKKWTSDQWGKTLQETIYWYLRANNISQGIDTGIILAQTAIERLAYEYAVNDKRSISSSGFQKLTASDKYRILFSTLGIPLDIPQTMPELQKLANQLQPKWEDAPQALTEIRNSLVHPIHKHRDKFNDNVYFETWKLSLWYLELGILAVCGYNDVYCSRIQNTPFARLDKVPWSTE